MTMTDSDPESGRPPLHPLEFRILVALLEEARHGYDIVKRIEATEPSSSRVYPANLYRRIRDLHAQGLVEETEPGEGSPDARRRYFALTASGRRVAAAELRRLERLIDEARAGGLRTASRSET
jgi:DNA-binding PadR family transcriptional regulator